MYSWITLLLVAKTYKFQLIENNIIDNISMQIACSIVYMSLSIDSRYLHIATPKLIKVSANNIAVKCICIIILVI